MSGLADLRRFAVARSLFGPTTLGKALDRFGFVQADPIRAPARAQDLILRHRVAGYTAGDLERVYPNLGVEEDHFINYGFVTRALYALMHPRPVPKGWSRARKKHAAAVLEFVRANGEAHPREVEDHVPRGRVTNYWGRSSRATTQLLELLHYYGDLRVVRREAGIRIYAASARRESAISKADAPEAGDDAGVDRLVDVVVGTYAPLPAASLSQVISRIRYGAPQWHGELRRAFQRAKGRLAHTRTDGVDWYWPADERADDGDVRDEVRLLAPFDPIVWDRRRFELLWGWAYRFEAYTPARKRERGYYALPLLWRDRVLGWANLGVSEGRLTVDVGYVTGKAPRGAAFRRELDAELDRMRVFLGPRLTS